MTYRDIYRSFALVLASAMTCIFADVPRDAKGDNAPISQWIEPDVFLRVAPLMLVAQPYNVSITFKNTSASDWSMSEVSLRQTSPPTTWFQNQFGHALSAEENRVQLPQAVRAGERVTVTFQVRAPAERGRHQLAWQLYNQSGPMASTAASREIVVATLEDVTPPGQRPPVDVRPFPVSPPPF